jgi:hypothetical protein
MRFTEYLTTTVLLKGIVTESGIEFNKNSDIDELSRELLEWASTVLPYQQGYRVQVLHEIKKDPNKVARTLLGSL